MQEFLSCSEGMEVEASPAETFVSKYLDNAPKKYRSTKTLSDVAFLVENKTRVHGFFSFGSDHEDMLSEFGDSQPVLWRERYASRMEGSLPAHRRMVLYERFNTVGAIRFRVYCPPGSAVEVLKRGKEFFPGRRVLRARSRSTNNYCFVFDAPLYYNAHSFVFDAVFSDVAGTWIETGAVPLPVEAVGGEASPDVWEFQGSEDDYGEMSVFCSVHLSLPAEEADAMWESLLQFEQFAEYMRPSITSFVLSDFAEKYRTPPPGLSWDWAPPESQEYEEYSFQHAMSCPDKYDYMSHFFMYENHKSRVWKRRYLRTTNTWEVDIEKSIDWMRSGGTEKIEYEDESGKSKAYNIRTSFLKWWTENDLSRPRHAYITPYSGPFEESVEERTVNVLPPYRLNKLVVANRLSDRDIDFESDGYGTLVDFITHIWRVMCDENEDKFCYFARWIANLLQRPRERPTVVPWIIAPQGTGKSYIVDVLMRIIGKQLSQNITSEDWKSDFNAFCYRNVLVASQEMSKMSVGTWCKFKTAITEADFTVNIKNLPQFKATNICFFIVCTDSEYPRTTARSRDPSATERRFNVLQGRDVVLDEETWDTRYKAVEGATDVVYEIAAFFMTLDLDRMQGDLHKHMRLKGEDQLRSSLDVVGLFLLNALKTGEAIVHWPRFIQCTFAKDQPILLSDLHDLYKEYTGHKSSKRLDDTQFRQRLLEYLPYVKICKSKVSKSWTCHFEGLRHTREMFERRLRVNIEWQFSFAKGDVPPPAPKSVPWNLLPVQAPEDWSIFMKDDSGETAAEKDWEELPDIVREPVLRRVGSRVVRRKRRRDEEFSCGRSTKRACSV